MAVELYRTNGNVNNPTLMASDPNPRSGTDALIYQFTIPAGTADDTYYVHAKNPGVPSGNAHPYRVGIWLEDNTLPRPTTGSIYNGGNELESNNTAATANDFSTSWRAVQYQSHTTAAISPANNADFFRYKFTSGDLVTVGLHTTSSVDLKATLYDSTGTKVIAADDGTSFDPIHDASVYAFVIPSTGYYYVTAEGSNSSTSGTYAADVYLSSNTIPPGTGTANYGALISTDVYDVMHGVNSSAYLRIPFNVADPSALTSLILKMKYDDGFVAYLNGVQVASRNAPATSAWNSQATAEHPVAQALVYESIDITAYVSALQPGANVLAIQGMNLTASDSDFLILPDLSGTTVTLGTPQYFTARRPAP